MSGSATAAVLAVCSAVGFGLASALQHVAASAAEQRSSLDPGLLTALARRPVWLLGIVADVAAVALQAAALHFGAVTLVQAVLVSGLPVAVALSALFARRALLPHEGGGLLLCTAGLALLCPATATVGLGREPTRSAGLLAGLVVVVVTGALLLVAARAPGLRAPATGTAAGVVVGAGSVLLAVCAGRTADLPALFGSIAPYATVAAGAVGLLLSQAAFQTGALGAPLAALSVVEPVVAVVLATAVLHEQLPTSGLKAAAVGCGAALAIAGVVVLCRPGTPVDQPAEAG